ncbi:MAG TPA: sulfite oxidase-like oxidoreductase [Myxococcaceae bacterium]|nr:sulfite oxidase-like oxidoreductase [Myxococcaceae bacterium]
MADKFVARGFVGKRREGARADRVPPGQYLTEDFPVLSAGPTPRTPLDRWSLAIEGLVQRPKTWTWQQFRELPSQTFVVDIHCVTKWSKLDTRWEGVSLDTLFAEVALAPGARYLTAFCDGGYTTNLPVAEVTGGQAFIAHTYDGRPLAPEHGGPARLVVPRLYFWKSAKWIRGLRLTEEDHPGFWEGFGYNNHGDPWKEERYSG